MKSFMDEAGAVFDVPENEIEEFMKQAESSGKKMKELEKKTETRLFKDENGEEFEVPLNEMREFENQIAASGRRVTEVKKNDFKRDFVNDKGETFRVPVEEVAEFTKTAEKEGIKVKEVEKKEQKIKFRGEDGTEYEVPESEKEEFLTRAAEQGKNVLELKNLGVIGTIKKNQEAKYGEMSWGETLYSMLPIVGEAEQTRQEMNERALFNGEYNDTLEGGKIAAAAGVPQEVIDRIYEETGSGGRNRFGGWNQHDLAQFKSKMKAIIEPVLKKRIETREGAKRELQANDLNWAQKVAVGLSGATEIAPMMNTPAAIATTPSAAVVGAARLSMPELSVDENGEIVETAKGDSEGTAIAKSLTGEVAERVIWMGLGKFLKKAGGKLVEKVPFLDKLMGKIAGKPMMIKSNIEKELAKSAGGRIILKTGEVLGEVEEKLHLGSLPSMMLKSRLTELTNEVVGLDVQDEQEKESFAQWLHKFVSLDENVELLTSLIGIHAAMGGYSAVKASIAQKRFRNNAREILGEYLDESNLDKLSNEDLSMLTRIVTSKGMTLERAERFLDETEAELKSAKEKAEEGGSYTELKEASATIKSASEQGIEAGREMLERIKANEKLGGEEAEKIEKADTERTGEEFEEAEENTERVKSEEELMLEEDIAREIQELREAGEIVAGEESKTEEREAYEKLEDAFEEAKRKEKIEPTEEERTDKAEEQKVDRTEDERLAEEITGDRRNSTTPVEREDGTFGELPKVAREISGEVKQQKTIQDVKEPRTINEAVSIGPDLKGAEIVEGRNGKITSKSMPDVKGEIKGDEIVIDNLSVEDFVDEAKLRKTIVYLVNAQKLAEDRGLRIVFTGENANEIKDLANAAYHQIKERGYSMVNAFNEMRRLSALEWLAKSGLGNGFVVNAEEFERVIREDPNGKMLSSGFRPWGYVSNEGKVYINPVYFETDVPVHEYGHLAQEALKKVNPTLLEHGYRMLEKDPIGRKAIEEIRSMVEYRHLDEEGLKEEALNHLIENAGKGMLDRGAENMGMWIDAMWKDLGAEWGLGDLTVEQVSHLSIGEVADAIAAEMLQGGIKNRTFGDVKNNWGEKETTGADSKPFPFEFPEVVVHANREMTKHSTRLTKMFDKAKAGDMASALAYTGQLYSAALARALKYRHPKAWIVPVIAENPEGRNRIPLALATHVAKASGMKLTRDIVQTSTGKRRGAGLLEHITMPIMFAGKVRKGQEYVIVDDHNTSGTTFQAMRTFIEANGGKVVECMALTQGSRGLPKGHKFGKLTVSQEQVDKIRKLYEGYNIDETLRRKGLASGCESLTGTQAEIILRTARQKVIESLGLERGSEESRGEVRTGSDVGDGSGLRGVSAEEAAAIIATPELKLGSYAAEKAAERLGKFSIEAEIDEDFDARAKVSQARKNRREAEEFGRELDGGKMAELKKAGDERAFNLLVLKNHAKIVNWTRWGIAKGLLSEAVAEDIVQDMWIEASKKFLNIENRPDYGIWTFIRNSIQWRVRQELKNKRIRGRESLTLNEKFGNGEEDTSERIEMLADRGLTMRGEEVSVSEEERNESKSIANDRLAKILSHYPDQLKKIFYKRGVENKSLKEIATELGITPQKVNMVYEKMMREIRTGKYKERTPAATRDELNENKLVGAKLLGPEASVSNDVGVGNVKSSKLDDFVSDKSVDWRAVKGFAGRSERQQAFFSAMKEKLGEGKTKKEIVNWLTESKEAYAFGYNNAEKQKVLKNIDVFALRYGLSKEFAKNKKVRQKEAANKIVSLLDKGYTNDEILEWFHKSEEGEYYSEVVWGVRDQLTKLRSKWLKANPEAKAGEFARKVIELARKDYSRKEIAEWMLNNKEGAVYRKNTSTMARMIDRVNDVCQRYNIETTNSHKRNAEKRIDLIRNMFKEGFSVRDIAKWFIENKKMEEFGFRAKSQISIENWIRRHLKENEIKPLNGVKSRSEKIVEAIKEKYEAGYTKTEIAKWLTENEEAAHLGYLGKDFESVYSRLRNIMYENFGQVTKDRDIVINRIREAINKKQSEGLDFKEIADWLMKAGNRERYGIANANRNAVYDRVRHIASKSGIKSTRNIAGKFEIGNEETFTAEEIRKAEDTFYQKDGFIERHGSLPKEMKQAADVVIKSRGISGLTFYEGKEVPEAIRMKGPGWAIHHRTKTVKAQLEKIYPDLARICDDTQLAMRIEQKGCFGIRRGTAGAPVAFEDFARPRKFGVRRDFSKASTSQLTYFLEPENQACNEAPIAWSQIILNEGLCRENGKRVFKVKDVVKALELYTPKGLIKALADIAKESGAKSIYKPDEWPTIADKWLAEKVAKIAFNGKMTEGEGFGAWYWNNKEANTAIKNLSLFKYKDRPRSYLGDGLYNENGIFVMREGAAKEWLQQQIEQNTGIKIDTSELVEVPGYQEALSLYARGGREISAYTETNRLLEEVESLTGKKDSGKIKEVNSEEGIDNVRNQNSDGRGASEDVPGLPGPDEGLSRSEGEGASDGGREGVREGDYSGREGEVRNGSGSVGEFSIDPLGDVFGARPEKHVGEAESEWNNGGISYAIEQSEAIRPWTRPGSPAYNDEPIAFDAADLVRFYRKIAKAKRPMPVTGKINGDLNGIQIAAKIFGVIDKSDVSFVKDSLKDQGYFRYEDPIEAEKMSASELHEDAKRSWKALDEELHNLYEYKVRTAEGGNHESTMVVARELGQILLQMPVDNTTGPVVGNAKKLLSALVARVRRNLTIADEMKKAVAWWHGQEECPEYYEGDKLAAEVFGILLTQPEKLKEIAPRAYQAFVDTLAENESLSKSYREFCAAKWNGKADDLVVQELERTWDEKMARRIRELEIKAEKPNWKWIDDFNYALNDRFGPMFALSERGFKERKIRWEKLEKEGRITPKMRQELVRQSDEIMKSLKSRLYDYQRAIGGEIRMMVYGFNEVIEKAKANNVNWYAVRRYTHLMRIIELGGRATAHAITPMRAAKLLENMKTKLGEEEFAKVESTAKEFRAVYEREIVDNPEVQVMFDGRTNAMLKRNKHYVTMKHTLSAEEVEAYEKEIEEYKHESDTRDPTFDLWIRLHRGLEVDGTGRNGYRLSPLVGSFDATKDPIAETMKKAIEIRMAAKRNTLIRDLGKVLQMANVRDVYSNVKRQIYNQRLGTLVYMEYGKTQRLIVPRIIEKCFNTEGSLSVLPGVQETMRALRHTMTIWNPSFINRAYMIDKSSLETNVKGLHKAPVDVISEALMLKIPFTNVQVGVPLYAMNNYLARFTNFTQTWIGKLLYGPNTVNHYARQAQKIASIVYEAKFGEMIEKAKQLREEGRTSEASEIEENVTIAKEMLKHNVFQSQYEFNAVQKAVSTEEILNAFNIGQKEVQELDRIQKTKEKAKAAGRAWNRYGEEQEAVSKIITWLYDEKNHPDADVAARARLTIEQGGTPNLNARGILASWIENATGFFWNVRKEGVLRSWRAFKDHPTEWAVKATVQTMLPQFIKGLAITGTLAAIVKKILFNDDEKKMNESALAPIIQYYEWMGKALRNVPSYEQRNYNVIPLAMNEDGTGTIGLRIKWSPEEFAIVNAVHAFTQSIAEKPTDPSADPSTALSGAILELLPNFEGVNPVSSWTWALLAPWLGINPYDSFRQRNLYTDDAMLARWLEPKYIGKEMLVNSVNYSPIGSLVKVIDNKRDVAEDAKPSDEIDMLLNGIPVISRVARSCIGYWSAPEKSGAVAGLLTVDKERNAVIKLQASEVLAKMMERDQLTNVGEEIRNVCGNVDVAKKSAVMRYVISGWRAYCRANKSSQQYRLMKEAKKLKDPELRAKAYQYIRESIEQDD